MPPLPCSSWQYTAPCASQTKASLKFCLAQPATWPSFISVKQIHSMLATSISSTPYCGPLYTPIRRCSRRPTQPSKSQPYRPPGLACATISCQQRRAPADAAVCSSCLAAPHLAVLHARLHFDLQGFPLPLHLDIVALLTLLGGVLLVHPWTQLACDHLVLAAALPLSLGRLDHVLVTCDLQGALSDLVCSAIASEPSQHTLLADNINSYKPCCSVVQVVPALQSASEEGLDDKQCLHMQQLPVGMTIRASKQHCLLPLGRLDGVRGA